MLLQTSLQVTRVQESFTPFNHQLKPCKTAVRSFDLNAGQTRQMRVTWKLCYWCICLEIQNFPLDWYILQRAVLELTTRCPLRLCRHRVCCRNTTSHTWFSCLNVLQYLKMLATFLSSELLYMTHCPLLVEVSIIFNICKKLCSLVHEIIAIYVCTSSQSC